MNALEGVLTPEDVWWWLGRGVGWGWGDFTLTCKTHLGCGGLRCWGEAIAKYIWVAVGCLARGEEGRGAALVRCPGGQDID